MANAGPMEQEKSHKYGSRRLTSVFLVALALIAVLSSVAHSMHRSATEQFHATAEAINRAGRQRMLCQRVVLLATQAASAPDDQKLQSELHKTSAELLNGNLWVKEKANFNPGVARLINKSQLDEQLVAFVQTARVVALGSPEALTQLNHELDAVAGPLNAVVTELENSQSDADLLTLSTYTWIATLGLLAVEALFIFFPMVQGIVRTQERLKKRQRELEVSNEQLRRFAYVASHDLKEPLRTVSSFSQLFSETLEGSLNEESSEYLRLIQEGAVRGERLVDDLLSYAKISNGSLPQSSVDLNSVVKTVQDDFSALMRENGGQIHAESLPSVAGVHTQVRQVIQNLVSNAMKFSREGVAPIVRISAQKREDRWAITVRDNGIGFDEKHVAKILRPFQRLHHASEKEGTGIGLSVVDLIVKRHGGCLEVSSSEGQGSTFTFDLAPASPAAQAELT